MQARHVEERREMFLGEELVYYVVVIDSPPAPSDDGPYAPEGRCLAGATTLPIWNAAFEPTPKRIPTKAEYVRSFQDAVAPLPWCVRQRRSELEVAIDGVHRDFALTGRRMPARLVRALAWYDAGDLACVYDAGRVARIHHYFRDHTRRVARRHSLEGAAL